MLISSTQFKDLKSLYINELSKEKFSLENIELNDKEFQKAIEFIENYFQNEGINSSFLANNLDNHRELAFRILRASLISPTYNFDFYAALLASIEVNQSLSYSTVSLSSLVATRGIREKFIKNSLTAKEALTAVDLQRMLDLMEIKDNIHVVPSLFSDARSLGTLVHFEREKNSKRDDYSFSLLVNLKPTSLFTGAHWVAVTIKVKTSTQQLSYTIQDSMKCTPQEINDYKTALEKALRFEETTPNLKPYKAFPEPWTITGEVTHTAKREGYSTGYQALWQVLQEEPGHGNDLARTYRETPHHSKQLIEQFHRLHLNDFKIAEGAYRALNTSQQALFTPEGQVLSAAVNPYLQMLQSDNPNLLRPSKPVEINPRLQAPLLKLDANTQIIVTPSADDTPFEVHDYENFFTQLQFKLNDFKEPLKVLLLKATNQNLIDGFNSFADLNTRLNVGKIKLELDASWDSPSSITKLKLALMNFSKLDVGRLAIIDDEQRISELQWQDLAEFIQQHRISLPIDLPKNYSESTLQRQIDDIISINQRAKNMAQLGETTTIPQPSLKMVAKRARIKNKKAAINIDVELEHTREIEVEVAREISTDKIEENTQKPAIKGFDLNELISAILLEELHLKEEAKLITKDSLKKNWHLWLGNIVKVKLNNEEVDALSLDAPLTKEADIFPSPIFQKVSAAAAEQLLNNQQLFQGGIHPYRLPQGFLLQLLEGSQHYLLHYDKNLAPEAQPLAPVFTTILPLPPVAADVANEMLLKAPIFLQSMAAQLDKESSRKTVQTFRTHLPQLMLFTPPQLEKLKALCWPKKPEKFNARIFDYLLNHYLQIAKTFSGNDTKLALITLEKQLEGTNRSVEEFVATAKSLSQATAQDKPQLLKGFQEQHFLVKLLENSALAKDVLAWSEKLNFNVHQMNALFQVYSQYGEKGLSQLFDRWVATNEQQLKHLHQTLFKKANSFIPFINSPSLQEALDRIEGFEPAQLVWWNELLKQHSATVGYEDLAPLVEAFIEFSKKIKDLGLNFYTDIHFSNIKNLPVALSIMLEILINCKKEDLTTQWALITELSLQSNGALRPYIDHSNEPNSRCRFIIPQMQVHPVRYGAIWGYGDSNPSVKQALGGKFAGTASTNLDEQKDSLFLCPHKISTLIKEEKAKAKKAKKAIESELHYKIKSQSLRWSLSDINLNYSYTVTFNDNLSALNNARIFYYRYLAHERYRLPLEFYQAMDEEIVKRGFLNAEQAFLYYILINSTTGAANREKCADLQQAKNDWIEILDILGDLHSSIWTGIGQDNKLKQRREIILTMKELEYALPLKDLKQLVLLSEESLNTDSWNPLFISDILHQQELKLRNAITTGDDLNVKMDGAFNQGFKFYTEKVYFPLDPEEIEKERKEKEGNTIQNLINTTGQRLDTIQDIANTVAEIKGAPPKKTAKKRQKRVRQQIVPEKEPLFYQHLSVALTLTGKDFLSQGYKWRRDAISFRRSTWEATNSGPILKRNAPLLALISHFSLAEGLPPENEKIAEKIKEQFNTTYNHKNESLTRALNYLYFIDKQEAPPAPRLQGSDLLTFIKDFQALEGSELENGVILDFIEEKFPAYFPEDFFTRARSSEIPNEVLALLEANLDDEKKEHLITLLQKYSKNGDSLLYYKFSKILIDILSTLDSKEPIKFLSMLNSPQLNLGGSIEEMIDLLETIRASSPEQFVFFTTKALQFSKKTGRPVEKAVEKSQLYLTDFLPAIKKMSKTISTLDGINLASDLLLNLPFLELDAHKFKRADQIYFDQLLELLKTPETLDKGRVIEAIEQLKQHTPEFKWLAVDALHKALQQPKEDNFEDLLEEEEILWNPPILSGIDKAYFEIAETLEKRGSYAYIFEELLSFSCQLVDAYPSDKKLILDFLNPFLTNNYSQTEEQFLFSWNSTQIISQELIALNDADMVRSLCSHFNSNKEGFSPKDLLELLKDERNMKLTQKEKKLTLTILTSLINNDKSCSIKSLLTLMAYKNKALGAVLLEQLECFYTSPPYPSLENIQTWFNEAPQEDSQVFKNYLQEAYSNFDKAPYTREAENGFHLPFAKIQAKKISGISHTDEELVAFDKEIQAVKLLSRAQLTEELLQERRGGKPLTTDRIIALSAELLYRTKGSDPIFVNGKQQLGHSFEINTTQYLALHAMLKCGKHVTSEIATGEGKSRILILQALCQYARGQTVDFVTRDIQLAMRDYLSYKALFQAVGAKTNLIYQNTPAHGYLIDGINFSDAANISLLRNKGRSEGLEHLVINPDPKKRAVILDESDQVFFDQAAKRYNYSALANANLREMPWIYDLLIEYFSADNPERRDFYDKAAFISFATVNAPIKDSEKIKRLLTTINDAQFETWQDSALTALALVFKKDFGIKTDVQIETPEGPKYVSQIELIIENRQDPKSKYSFGTYQCLQARLNLILKREKNNQAQNPSDQTLAVVLKGAHGFYTESEKQIIYSSNSKSFLDEYQEGTLYAATGTMGTYREQKEARAFYRGTDATMRELVIARHQPSKRRDAPIYLSANKKMQDQLIIKQIKASRKINQPLIIFCKDDIETKRLETVLKAAQITENISAITAETSVEDVATHISEKMGKPQMVTLSTGMLGRGTDAKLHEQAKVTGLKVLLTYLPPNPRELEQIKGRAGRFGDPGDFQLLLNKQDLLKFLGKKSLNDGFYTATDSYIKQQQSLLVRQAQVQRIINFTVSSMRSKLQTNYFEFLKATSLELHPKLKEQWQEFTSECDKEWNKAQQLLLESEDRFKPKLEALKAHLKTYENLVNDRWENLKLEVEQQLEQQQVLRNPSPLEILKPCPPLDFSAKSEKLLTTFKLPALRVLVADRYHPAHDGKAVIYTRSFESFRAFFRGERRLFANRKARNEHRGIIFPNLRAWWNGAMSFRELLFGANSKSSIDVEAVAAAKELKKRGEKADKAYIEQEKARAAPEAEANLAATDQDIPPVEFFPEDVLKLLGGLGEGNADANEVKVNNYPSLFSSNKPTQTKENLENSEQLEKKIEGQGRVKRGKSPHNP